MGGWICNILVPRWFNKKQSFTDVMACRLWNLHICTFFGFLYHRYSRESHISSNTPYNLTPFCRSDTGQYFRCADCFTGLFCYLWCYITIKWQRGRYQNINRVSKNWAWYDFQHYETSKFSDITCKWTFCLFFWSRLVEEQPMVFHDIETRN